MPEDLPHVRVSSSADRPGRFTVELDGEDWSHKVSHVSVEFTTETVPMVTLTLPATEVDVEAAGAQFAVPPEVEPPADTAAERLAKALYLTDSPSDGAMRGAQRAIDDGWVHRGDLIAQGWTPPDPWEAIAYAAHTAAWPTHAWGPSPGYQSRLVEFFRDLIPDEGEAQYLAARIEEGT